MENTIIKFYLSFLLPILLLLFLSLNSFVPLLLTLLLLLFTFLDGLGEKFCVVFDLINY